MDSLKEFCLGVLIGAVLMLVGLVFLARFMRRLARSRHGKASQANSREAVGETIVAVLRRHPPEAAS